jgi:enterochelin esterase-like enzyme
LNEYCPYTVDVSFLKGVVGIGDETFRWIVEEIKPMIDEEYRTYSNRQCTGIAGSSMGGLMALYGAIAFNKWFSKAACVSSSIGVCMEEIKQDLVENPVDPDTRVYLSWGTKEAWGVTDHNQEDTTSFTYKDNRFVGDALEAQGAAVQLYCQVGGGHCEADWEKLVPGFMDFLWLR